MTVIMSTFNDKITVYLITGCTGICDNCLYKYNSSIVVHKYPILQIPVHCAGQDRFLQIASLPNQIIKPIPMRNPYDVLFNSGEY